MNKPRGIVVRPLSPERFAALMAKPRTELAPEEPTRFSHLGDQTILRMATPGTATSWRMVHTQEDRDAVEIEMGRRKLYGN